MAQFKAAKVLLESKPEVSGHGDVFVNAGGALIFALEQPLSVAKKDIEIIVAIEVEEGPAQSIAPESTKGLPREVVREWRCETTLELDA